MWILNVLRTPLTCARFITTPYETDGETRAQEILNDLRVVGIVERNDMDGALWKNVGKLKARQRASIADFCAITLTNRVGGTLLTSDHHELDAMVTAGVCSITFIR
jgi:hypothetical protein